MTQGLYILALGHISYLHWAINLAASVRVYSPSVSITIIHDGLFSKIQPDEACVFDHSILMDRDHYTDNAGMFQPGKAKLHLYDYFHHDENMFIDADSILIADILPVFEKCHTVDVGLQVYNKTPHDAENWDCLWAKWEKIPELYKLPDEFLMSEINSSFLYAKKNEVAAAFFKQAKDNYLEDYRSVWGKRFPDELAFDVATAQTGMSGDVPGFTSDYPVMMKSRSGKSILSISQLREISPILGFYGGVRTTERKHQENYDKQAGFIHSKIFGKSNPYKTHTLLRKKIVEVDGVQLNNQNGNINIVKQRAHV